MDSTLPTASITKRVEGKVAIVTGGASGIGASTARVFSQNGATVVIADDVQEELGRQLAKRLGDNVSFIRCDVYEEEQVRAAVDAVVDRHGRLDVMCGSNAGIPDRSGGLSVLDSSPIDLDCVLTGAFNGAKHAARVMTPRKEGCILFTVSACSSRDVISNYGIVGLVRNLSTELGKHGVRVNCISADGAGEEGVAKAALYLASDDASYVNGHNLVLHSNPPLLPH
ncbi:hypothetical protein V2J09_005720 [Rumex salicifolius]